MSIGSINPNDSFYVVLHDVAPRFTNEIAQIVELLAPLIGNQMAASVVPRWHGDSPEMFTPIFIDFVKDSFSEISLHGYSHQRKNGRGFRSWLTKYNDEFNGLNSQQTDVQMTKGINFIEKRFGLKPKGFISPTFAPGALQMKQLAAHGIEFTVWMTKIKIQNQPCVPIATWCWDVSHLLGANMLGHYYGYARMLLHRNLLPCLAIHPVDIERGFGDKIVSLVQSLLQQGRTPILLDSFQSPQLLPETSTQNELVYQP